MIGFWLPFIISGLIVQYGLVLSLTEEELRYISLENRGILLLPIVGGIYLIMLYLKI